MVFEFRCVTHMRIIIKSAVHNALEYTHTLDFWVRRRKWAFATFAPCVYITVYIFFFARESEPRFNFFGRGYKLTKNITNFFPSCFFFPHVLEHRERTRTHTHTFFRVLVNICFFFFLKQGYKMK